MRILYLCVDGGIDLAGRSGASIHIRNFVRALTELGHQGHGRLHSSQFPQIARRRVACRGSPRMDVAVAPYPALDDFYYSPIKLYEYRAAGRAVVASRVGQVAETIQDGVNGLLFDPGDRTGLINCLRRLQKDMALRNELGRRASAACSDHTWDRNAARVLGWVEPLVTRKRLVAVPA